MWAIAHSARIPGLQMASRRLWNWRAERSLPLRVSRRSLHDFLDSTSHQCYGLADSLCCWVHTSEGMVSIEGRAFPIIDSCSSTVRPSIHCYRGLAEHTDHEKVQQYILSQCSSTRLLRTFSFIRLLAWRQAIRPGGSATTPDKRQSKYS